MIKRVGAKVISKLRSSSSKVNNDLGSCDDLNHSIIRRVFATPFSADASRMLIGIKRRKTHSGAAIRSVRAKTALNVSHYCAILSWLRNTRSNLGFQLLRIIYLASDPQAVQLREKNNNLPRRVPFQRILLFGFISGTFGICATEGETK